MNFRVGQKVVCVDDSFPDNEGWVSLPVRGQVYTVRAIMEFKFRNRNDLGVYLCELKNPVRHWADGDYCEHALRATRFRPVVERKTDISIFTRMLTPAPRVKDQTPCASS